MYSVWKNLPFHKCILMFHGCVVFEKSTCYNLCTIKLCEINLAKTWPWNFTQCKCIHSLDCLFVLARNKSNSLWTFGNQGLSCLWGWVAERQCTRTTSVTTCWHDAGFEESMQGPCGFSQAPNPVYLGAKYLTVNKPLASFLLRKGGILWQEI
jgi:hypothetical protein